MGKLLARIFPRTVTRRIDKIVRWVVFVVSVILFGAIVIDYGFELTDVQEEYIRDVYKTAWWFYFADFFGRLILQWFSIKRKAMVITVLTGIWLFLSALPVFLPGLLEHHATEAVWALFSHKYFVVPLLGFLSVLSISKSVIEFISQNTNPALLLAAAFLVMIFVGAILLLTPRSLNPGVSLPIVDSLFISTSATCVTGLTTIDIASTFSVEGQIIILLLIQIGGLGVMTITCFFAVFFMGGNSLQNRFALRDMIGSKSFSSLISTLLYILGFTFVIELCGAVAIWLDIHDTMQMTLGQEIFYSIFHAISAFCNAGISNNPTTLQEMARNGHRALFIALTILIILGGIGFPILVNLKNALFYNIRRFFRRIFLRDNSMPKYNHLTNVNTKIVIFWTILLIIAGSSVTAILEWNNTLSPMQDADKVIHSVFNSVAQRSSGFGSIDFGSFPILTLMTFAILMWIGGASQSTAGGIKVNTIAVAIANFVSVIRGREAVTIFNREISPESVRRALATIFGSLLYITIVFVVLITLEPEIAPKRLLFETISAVCTVGSSLGITAELSMASKIIIIVSMFVGRVGLLTVVTSMFRQQDSPKYKLPKDNVIIN